MLLLVGPQVLIVECVRNASSQATDRGTLGNHPELHQVLGGRHVSRAPLEAETPHCHYCHQTHQSWNHN